MPNRRLSIAEARHALARIVHDVERGSPVELTRRGKPVAVIAPLNHLPRAARTPRGFFDACQQFRRQMKREKLTIDADVFEGVRDRSPGRVPS